LSTNYYIYDFDAKEKKAYNTIGLLKHKGISKLHDVFSEIEQEIRSKDEEVSEDTKREIFTKFEDLFDDILRKFKEDNTIHIGKSGWFRFIFTDYKRTYEDWVSAIKKADGNIFDEYGTEITADELLNIIISSEENKLQLVGKYIRKNETIMFDMLENNGWC